VIVQHVDFLYFPSAKTIGFSQACSWSDLIGTLERRTNTSDTTGFMVCRGDNNGIVAQFISAL